VVMDESTNPMQIAAPKKYHHELLAMELNTTTKGRETAERTKRTESDAFCLIV